jgi:hypothetical protein
VWWERRKSRRRKIKACVVRVHGGVAENSILLGYGALSPSNHIPTFRRIAVASVFRGRNVGSKMWTVRCLKTWASDYPFTLQLYPKRMESSRVSNFQKNSDTEAKLQLVDLIAYSLKCGRYLEYRFLFKRRAVNTSFDGLLLREECGCYMVVISPLHFPPLRYFFFLPYILQGSVCVWV